MDRRLLLLALVALLPALLSPPAVSACNEAVCASIVSKCTLLKSCECKPEPGQPCTCCERCKKCLDYSFTECCSCFELCPKRNVTEAIPESAVFEFKHPEPELWDALVGAGTASSSSGGSGDGDGSSGSGGTSGGSGGDLDQWERFTYPVDVHRSQLEVILRICSLYQANSITCPCMHRRKRRRATTTSRVRLPAATTSSSASRRLWCSRRRRCW